MADLNLRIHNQVDLVLHTQLSACMMPGLFCRAPKSLGFSLQHLTEGPRAQGKRPAKLVAPLA